MDRQRLARHNVCIVRRDLVAESIVERKAQKVPEPGGLKRNPAGVIAAVQIKIALLLPLKLKMSFADMTPFSERKLRSVAAVDDIGSSVQRD